MAKKKDVIEVLKPTPEKPIPEIPPQYHLTDNSEITALIKEMILILKRIESNTWKGH